MDRQTYPRVLMTASALAMGLVGLAASFLAEEIVRALGASPARPLALVVQLAGALYLGLATVNWMTRGHLVGGIYGRPLVLANLIHFMTGALALLKGVSAGGGARGFWPLALVYAVLAAGFSVLLFRHPLGPSRPAA